MRSLVTGGAGFIGSHVARCCLERGHEVVVLDDLSGGRRENVPPGATFIDGSVADRELIRAIFAEDRFDYIYHLAAYAAEGLSHFIRHFNYTNNLIGSINLINEAIKHEVKCFVFTSSIAVYGAGQVPMTEEQVPQPEDPYGIAKYAVELDLASSNHMFGVPYVIFRPHNVYGEHQNIADRYRNVIGIFMNQIMHNQPMTVFGDGLQLRAFSHIDDVAPHIARCVDVPAAMNQVFNIGSSTPRTVLEVAQGVAQAFGVPAQIEFLPQRNEVVEAYASHEKAIRVFGPGPDIGLQEGLDRMARWARLRGPLPTEPFAEIEVSENLPPSWAAMAK
jgi:UDP-glucose 4-epimerase